MADKFNVDAGVRQAPNLMPSSAGIGGNPGNVGAGIANTFDAFGGLFKGIMESRQQQQLNALSGEVGQNIDYQMTNQLDSRKIPPSDQSKTPTATEAPPAATETLENPRTGLLTETPKAAPQPSVAANTTLPGELRASDERILVQKTAYDQGRGRSDFWLRMSTLQRDLEAKYGPQFAPAIRQMFKDRLGVIPSQKYIEAMEKEQEQARTDMKEEDRRWISDKSEGAGLGIPANVLRAGDTDPVIREKIRTEVLSRKAKNAEVTAQLQALDLKKKQGEDVQNDVLRVARGTVRQEIDNAFGDVNSSMEAQGIRMQDINKKRDEAMADGVISPQEAQELSIMWQKFESSTMIRLNKALTPFYERIDDPKKFDELKKETESRLKFFRDNVINGNIGILEWNETARKNMQAGDAYSIGAGSDSLRKLGAIKVIGGEAAANAFFTNSANDINNDVKRATLAPRVAGAGTEMITGTPASEALKKHADGLQGPDKAKVINSTINEATRQMIDPKSSPEVVQNLAASMFGKGNRLMLQDYTPESQMKVFNTLVSPSMTAKMQELSKTDPKVYENYRSWVTTNFHSILKPRIDNLKSLVSGDNANSVNQANNPLVIGFDGTQFTVSVNPEKARLGQSGSIRSSVGQTTAAGLGSMRYTIEAVRDINRALQLAGPVLAGGKGEGKEVSQLLEPLLGGIGVAGKARTDLEYVAQAYNQWKLTGDQVDKISGSESPIKGNDAKPIAENPRTTPVQNLADPNAPSDESDLPPTDPTERTVTGDQPTQTSQGEDGYWVPRLQPNGKYQDVFVRKDGTPALNQDGTPMTKEQLGQTQTPSQPTTGEKPQPVLGRRDPSLWGKKEEPAPVKKGQDGNLQQQDQSTPTPGRKASNPLRLPVFDNAEQANNNPMVAGYTKPDDGSYLANDIPASGGDRSAGSGPTPVATGGPLDLTRYYQKTMSAESGGNSNAKNPRSSATGLFQFIGSTWKGLMKRYPQLGLTEDGRSDPAQQKRAMEAFTQENVASLRKAGLPVTNGTLYLAHFAGDGGAKALLRADASRPVEEVLGPKVVAANPFLKGKTAGWAIKWAERKMA